MTTIVEDFKAFIVASTSINATISGRCHYNRVPENSSRPHIWYQRLARDSIKTTTGATGLKNVTFDVECNAVSPTVAEALADKVHDKLHCYKGAFNNATAQLIDVDDRDDDYQPKSHGGDEGIHTFALSVSIWHTT